MGTRTININDVYLVNHVTNKYVKIRDHPYYISLLNHDKNVFEDYISFSKYQSSKPSGKWEHFIEIYKNIKKDGFDFSHSDDKIRILKKNLFFIAYMEDIAFACCSKYSKATFICV